MEDFLDSRQLRAFLALARNGSFTAAARELHLTQSAISHAIRVLEESLGCRLVHRSARQVVLSNHGRELLPHVESIEERMRQARTALRAMEGSPRGTLRIGCPTAASQFILPAVLREFQRSWPQFEIRVVPGESPAVVERILKDEVDVGLIIAPAEEAGIVTQTVFEDEIVFVVAPAHAWACEAEWQRNSPQTFIISTRQSYTWQLVSEALGPAGRMPMTLVELGSSEAVRELALTGYGVGICAAWTVTRDIADGRLISVAPPCGSIRRQWVAATLKGRALNAAEQAFLKLCSEASPLRAGTDNTAAAPLVPRPAAAGGRPKPAARALLPKAPE
jgi:DNA-binding transcriptional LysR family regulator